ncbi:MAG TPA: hypothetical protein GX534_07100 [Thermoanaerobacterales bacterium]|nr:hypothetical protein [Thermoanaerobacterales bacterium]
MADDTMYGEIIPSLMGWLSPEEQKERTDRLEGLSKEMAEKKDEMNE